MLRGYRSIFIAVVGWLVSAAANNSQPPQQRNPAERQQSSNEIEQAANTMASAIRNPQEAPEHDTGCEDRQDRRSSDLCAQWKAADAARDAASYSGWTLLVSTFGTILLVWTLWETRATARRELRAYVSIKPTKLRLDSKTGSVDVLLTIRNDGNTPAYRLAHRGAFLITAEPSAEHEVMRQRLPQKRNQLDGMSLAVGGEYDRCLVEGERPLTREELKAIASGVASFFVFGFVKYKDTFGYLRSTRYCFFAVSGFLSQKPDEGFAPGVSEMKWELTPFHNDAD